MKIRELIQSYHHLGETGDEILLKCVKDRYEGAKHFAEIYNALRKKGFSARDAIEGAMDGAEHVVRLEMRSPGPAVAPITSTQSAKMAAMEIANAAIFPPKKEPTFEESLNDHQRKCAVCREGALKEWNAKQGVK